MSHAFPKGFRRWDEKSFMHLPLGMTNVRVSAVSEHLSSLFQGIEIRTSRVDSLQGLASKSEIPPV